MKLIQAVLAVTYMLFSANGFAGKAEKVLICHVSSDDGTIQLINVSQNSNHLGNESHFFEGISDYEPSEIGASGEGTEDTNGDGIDDGCEPAQDCPCWDLGDLQSVTAANKDEYGCENGSTLPHLAVISNKREESLEVDGLFFAVDGVFNGGNPICGADVTLPIGLSISDDEVSTCIAQIAARCAAIGHAIPE